MLSKMEKLTRVWLWWEKPMYAEFLALMAPNKALAMAIWGSQKLAKASKKPNSEETKQFPGKEATAMAEEFRQISIGYSKGRNGSKPLKLRLRGRERP